MKKQLNDFKKYLDESAFTDFWTFGQGITFGVMASLAIVAYLKLASTFTKFVSKDTLSPQSFVEDEKGLSPGSDILGNLALSTLLLGVLLGSFLGAYRVRNIHQKRRQEVELQQRTGMTANLNELAEAAAEYNLKYGNYFKKTLASKKEHPRFLCEPESKQLMTMPITVASDGYARGYEEFKRIQNSKLNSLFTGEPLAPFGIIDQVLMGNMLAYIQDQSLPTKIMPVSRSKYDAKSKMLQFFKELLKELWAGSKFTAKTIYRDVIVIFGLLSAVCLLILKPRAHLENLEFIEKFMGNAHLLLMTAVLISLAFNLDLFGELNNWYNSKILLARMQTNNNDEDIEDASAELKSESDRLMCPITHARFKRPTIAEDGVTYEKTAIETFLEGKPVKKSPITHKEFKNSYPLLWHYTQLQEEINSITKQLNSSDQKPQLDISSAETAEWRP